ncbi:MAG TPA: ATP-binding cassette domain-containing protein [Nitrososphaerales archaeon]|nr:ATP-binding cassette domain-containing protein [Nitrososphaerales archaeon]
MEIVQVKNLSKVFDKEIVAVDNISFHVKEGEIFGFLGPNGAGKTTTIKVLTTLLQPTNGQVNIATFDVRKKPDSVRSSIGIVPQALTLDDDLKGMANLLLSAKLYHVPDKIAKERADELLKLVGLKDAAERDVSTYSGGMRKRLELIIGLIHNPKVLFLDEPTLGLDIQTRSVIWDYLKKLNKENGLTIFITTHYLEEADLLCDRIAIIDQGKILVEDTPSNLKQKLGGDMIEISVDDNVKAKELISEFSSVEKIDMVGQKLRIKTKKGDEVLPSILEICKANKINVKTVALSKPSLDEVFLEYTGRSLRDTRAGFSDKAAMQRVWKAR